MAYTFTANTDNKDVNKVVTTLNACFAEYSVARERLCIRAISIDRYEYLREMENAPYVEDKETFYLGLYLCLDENEQGASWCSVTPAFRHLWGVHEKVLWGDAYMNTPKMFPLVIKSLEETLGLPKPEGKPQMYVVTNEKALNGASALFYPDTLNTLYAMIGEEYYVIPSSIHEVLVTPVSLHNNPRELAEIVRQINATIVSESDYLSDNVFRYDYKRNDIIAVA